MLISLSTFYISLQLKIIAFLACLLIAFLVSLKVCFNLFCQKQKKREENLDNCNNVNLSFIKIPDDPIIATQLQIQMAQPR